MSSALPWLLGGAALGVGVLWLRKKQAEQATKPPASPCAAIAAATGVPESVCNAGLSILGDAVDAVSKTSADVAKWDAKNKELNGPIAVPFDGIRRGQLATAGAYPALDGTVIEFANGCQPMKGAPGWAKCAPGTMPMLNYPPHERYFEPDKLSLGALVAPGDTGGVAPMSGYARKRGEPARPFDPFTAGGVATAGGRFPIPVPTGHVGYYYKGRAFTCPVGKPPAFNVNDHRTLGASYVPPCGDPWGSSTPPRQVATATDGAGTPRSHLEGACESTPGFIWDTSDPRVPGGFCRRKRVGE